MPRAQTQTNAARRKRKSKRRKQRELPEQPNVDPMELPRQSLVSGVQQISLSDWEPVGVPSPAEYEACASNLILEPKLPGAPKPYQDEPLRVRRPRFNFARSRFYNASHIVIERSARTPARSSLSTDPPPPSQRPKEKKTSWADLPFEVRAIILKHDLVAEHPIMVHQKWQKLYFRRGSNRQELHLNLTWLRVNKQLHAEGAAVLYGCNIFHYLIRDATLAPPLISQLAFELPDVSEGEDSDYEDVPHGIPQRRGRRGRIAVRPPSRRTRRSRAEENEILIGIQTHLHLFRHLIIEVESNRADDNSKTLLAEAILIFAPEPQNVPKIPFRQDTKKYSRGVDDDKVKKKIRAIKMPKQPLPPNIRTLTLRISPVWTPGSQIFSMVHWFAPAEIVKAALNTIACRYINIELKMTNIFDEWNYQRVLDGSPGERIFEMPRNTRLQLDMFYRQNGEAAGEAAVSLLGGVQMAHDKRWAIGADIMNNLRTHIFSRCLKVIPKEAMDHDESQEAEGLWNDVEEGFEDHGEDN